MKSLIKYIIYTFLFFMITFDLFSCKKLKNNIISFIDDEEIATITSDNETEFINSIKTLNENGGTIYIDTPIIHFNIINEIKIINDFPGGIIGIRQPNGEYPILNFMKGNYLDLFSGINIWLK